MKNMRRILAMALAVMLALTLATAAFAAENTTSYEVYQIFTGDYSDGVLSNVKWGQNGTGAEGEAVSDTILAELEEVDSTASNSSKLAVITPYANLTGTPFTTSTSDTISDLPAGYYLIKDAAGSQEGEHGVYTTYVVKVVDGSVTITRKVAVPTVDKTVDESDANIGDTVTFTLTGTLPNNYGDYKTYTYIFHDTMSAGLTYTDGSAKVTLDTADGTDITSLFNIDCTGNVLTVKCVNLKTNDSITKDSKIVVTYTAVLNEKAVIAGDGNPNEVYLEYSNDPNWQGDPTDPETPPPTGDTPKDEVKVYTWEIPVFKYTGTDTPLAGARFTLYKGDTVINLVAAGDNIYKVCTKTDCTHTHVTEIITGDTGRFEIEGLEQGTYTLKETKAPDGYNSVGDVTVEIGEGGKLNPRDDGTGNIVHDTEIKVLNQAGSTLPETGGVGTTMFYLFGGIMVVAAAVLLVTKKRMAA